MSKFQPGRTREYLNHHYNELNKSSYEIAKENNTYANKINRELVHYGYRLRTKSEAQANAIKSGRHIHPTKGKTRDLATKEKIGNTVSNSWKNLSEEERARRSETAKDQWANMSEAEKADLHSKAAKAVRHASQNGSKIEQYLLLKLRLKQIKVDFHKENLVANNNLQVDLFLPECGIAIEIDGPTHFLPIWGEENLVKHQVRDREKNGLLLNAGYKVIRIKVLAKNVSAVYQRKILDKVLLALDKINQGNNINVEDRYIEIDVEE